jgi:hypothetical protein
MIDRIRFSGITPRIVRPWSVMCVITAARPYRWAPSIPRDVLRAHTMEKKHGDRLDRHGSSMA